MQPLATLSSSSASIIVTTPIVYLPLDLMSSPDNPTPLEFEILLALGQGPLHGYGIVQDIEGRSRSFGDLRSGTLYLALRRLTAMGLIERCPPPAEEVGGDGRRKFVRLTPAGRTAMAEELSRLRRALAVAEARELIGPEPS